MISVHPELERIYREYCLLVDAYTAGNVTADDAQRILSGLTAVDGEGTVWSIDASSGEFLRAAPGMTPQPTDPARFAASRLPPAHIEVPPHGAHPSMVSEHLHPALQPTAPESPRHKVGRAVGAGLGGAAKGAGGALSGLRSLLSGRGRTVALVLVAGVAAFAIITGSPSQKEPEPSTDSVAVSSSVAVPDISIPGEPATSSPTLPPTSVPDATAVPAMPTDAELEALAGVFNAADPASLLLVLPEDPASRLAFAELLGSPRLGHQISLRNPVETGIGVKVRAVVGDPSDPVATWSILLGPAAPWKALGIEPA